MKALHVVLGLWLFSVARASVAFTNSDFSGITPGKPFTITWTGQSSGVKLYLLSGSSSNLATVLTIGTSLTGTSYIWTPPTTLPGGTYTLEISDGSDINYSPQFTLTGGATAQSSSPTTQSNAAPSVDKSTPIVTTPPEQTSTTTTTTTTPLTSSPPTTTSTSPSTTSPSDTSPFDTSPSTTSPQRTSTSDSSSNPTITAFPTTTSSTPSPISSVQSISDSGLGTGAKAGIGVGVVLGAAIVILIIWLIFRRRRTQEERVRRDAEKGGANSPVRGPELMTAANTHEMAGKPAVDPQVAEVEGQNSAKGEELDSEHVSPVAPGGVFPDAKELEANRSRILQELGSEEKAIVRKALPLEMQTQSNVPEMATATNVGSDWERLHPSELDSKMIDKPALEPSGPIVTPKAPLSESTNPQQNEPTIKSSTITSIKSPVASIASIAGSPAASPVGSGVDELEALQKRMEHVRADKERLLRIQQLEDLEAELQRDITAEQKRRQDAASSS